MPIAAPRATPTPTLPVATPIEKPIAIPIARFLRITSPCFGLSIEHPSGRCDTRSNLQTEILPNHLCRRAKAIPLTEDACACIFARYETRQASTTALGSLTPDVMPASSWRQAAGSGALPRGGSGSRRLRQSTDQAARGRKVGSELPRGFPIGRGVSRFCYQNLSASYFSDNRKSSRGEVTASRPALTATVQGDDQGYRTRYHGCAFPRARNHCTIRVIPGRRGWVQPR